MHCMNKFRESEVSQLSAKYMFVLCVAHPCTDCTSDEHLFAQTTQWLVIQWLRSLYFKLWGSNHFSIKIFWPPLETVLGLHPLTVSGIKFIKCFFCTLLLGTFICCLKTMTHPETPTKSFGRLSSERLLIYIKAKIDRSL